MLKFFDLLYYKLQDFYTLMNNGRHEGGASSFLIAGLQLFNIMSLTFLYDAIRNAPISISKVFIILLYACLFFINYFRYVYFDKVRLKSAEEWERKTPGNKRIWTRLFIVYTLVSFLTLF